MNKIDLSYVKELLSSLKALKVSTIDPKVFLERVYASMNPEGLIQPIDETSKKEIYDSLIGNSIKKKWLGNNYKIIGANSNGLQEEAELLKDHMDAECRLKEQNVLILPYDPNRSYATIFHGRIKQKLAYDGDFLGGNKEHNKGVYFEDGKLMPCSSNLLFGIQNANFAILRTIIGSEESKVSTHLVLTRKKTMDLPWEQMKQIMFEEDGIPQNVYRIR